MFLNFRNVCRRGPVAPGCEIMMFYTMCNTFKYQTPGLGSSSDCQPALVILINWSHLYKVNDSFFITSWFCYYCLLSKYMDRLTTNIKLVRRRVRNRKNISRGLKDFPDWKVISILCVFSPLKTDLDWNAENLRVLFWTS